MRKIENDITKMTLKYVLIWKRIRSLLSPGQTKATLLLLWTLMILVIKWIQIFLILLLTKNWISILRIVCKVDKKGIGVTKNNLHITPQFYRKFYPRGCSKPKIYGLPKIHKTGVPLRPIVSPLSSPMAKLGKWLLAALCPILGTQSSYKLKNFTLEERSIICSFDVVSMYFYCNLKNYKEILRIKLQKELWFDTSSDHG